MKSTWRDRVAVEATLSRDSLANYCEMLRVVLDSNHRSLEEKPKIEGYLRSRRIDLLLEFADSHGRAVHTTASDHYLANQLVSLIKKVPFDAAHFGIHPEAAAIVKFRASERRCRRYNRIAALENKLKRWRSEAMRNFCRGFIRRVIGEKPVFPKIWRECDFGPGASVGVSGDVTHLAAKLLAPRWSVTPSALPYALAAVRFNPNFWELLLGKEDTRHFSWDPSRFEEVFMDRCVMVNYNNIALVPKTAKIHRTIAVEPLLNGYLQKGVDVFMRRALRRFGIDLKDQSRNQELARLGSIPGGDPYATIDLSEASDSISIALAKDLLPPEWFHFLNAIRSPSWRFNEVITPYEKFCSMGNGFCFPLETLIFASVCQYAYDLSSRRADFSVYGDDIIVRGSLAAQVLNDLKTLGFRHNPEKTFLSGPFRESCGADWFLGEDVRPVTLDYLPATIPEVFGFHNQTLRSDRCSVYFSETREFLRALIPPRMRYMRPVEYAGNADTAFRVEKDLFMTCSHTTWNVDTYSWKWKELASYSQEDREVRRVAMYHIALLQMALRGGSSETPFTKRRNTRTRVGFVSHHGGPSTWLPFTQGGLYAPQVLAPATPQCSIC